MTRSLTVEGLEVILSDAMPIDADDGSVSLAGAGVTETAEGDLRLALRLIVWDTRGADRQVEQIVEQDVMLVPSAARDDAERVGRFVRALARVLPAVLARDVVHTLLPHELVPAGALKLARAESEEDFERALLTKARLGRFL